MNERGSLTLEAAFVVPAVMLFIALLLMVNIKVFGFAETYISRDNENFADYANVHRKVSAVFDAGENIYEILFG